MKWQLKQHDNNCNLLLYLHRVFDYFTINFLKVLFVTFKLTDIVKKFVSSQGGKYLYSLRSKKKKRITSSHLRLWVTFFAFFFVRGKTDASSLKHPQDLAVIIQTDSLHNYRIFRLARVLRPSIRPWGSQDVPKWGDFSPTRSGTNRFTARLHNGTSNLAHFKGASPLSGNEELHRARPINWWRGANEVYGGGRGGFRRRKDRGGLQVVIYFEGVP